jgi:hypothetical protein
LTAEQLHIDYDFSGAIINIISWFEQSGILFWQAFPKCIHVISNKGVKMKRKILSCCISIIIGALLAIGFMLLLDNQPVKAGTNLQPQSPAAFTRYVATDGNDYGGTSSCLNSSVPCRTVQVAVNVAGSGDEIRVATGVYTDVHTFSGGIQVVSITKTVTIRGGYTSTNWMTSYPITQPTVLDAQRQGRVVYISGNVTPTLDGLIVTRGNATGLTDECESDADGCGGGIFVLNAHPRILNNTISNNVATLTTSGFPRTTGYGGGLFMKGATGAVISGNVIISNTAGMARCGAGGGIYLFMSGNGNSGMQVLSNQVLSNTAATTYYNCAWGGGIHNGPDGVLIQGNTIAGNRANVYGGGMGAGIYQWYGSATYLFNLVTGNLGSASQAVYLGHSQSRFEGNRVVDNATSQGVQLAISEGGGPRLVNNVIARSGEQTVAATGYAGYPLTATLLHNTLVGSGTGYGIYVESGYVTLYLTNTIVASHTWGITNTFPASSTVHADHTLFWANTHNGIQGTNPVSGNPAFAADGYHLGSDSAAIDRGVNAGVATDIDGEARPIGCTFDIGADEFFTSLVCQYIHLPLVLKNH